MAISTSPRSLGPHSTRTKSSVPTAKKHFPRSALDSPLADYYLIMGACGLLMCFGVTMVLSSSSMYALAWDRSPYYYLIRQATFMTAGICAMWWLSRRSERSLRRVAWVALTLSLIALAITLTPLGLDASGNRGWIDLKIGQIQPSEFAKFAIVLWGSAIFSEKTRQLDRPQELLHPYLLGTCSLVAIVLFEKDLGTAVVMMLVVMALLWLVGTSWRILGSLFAIAGVVVGVLILLSGNRMGRFTTFLNPEKGPHGMNEQALSGMYALASGGWWGRGLGRSRQKFGSLPEAHTDYVFAILGEELGLFGTLLVIVLLFILAWAGLRVARRSSRPFFQYVAGGITLWFLMQAVLNILMVLRFLPVFGVPLPFVSYGGSALLANLAGLGVLLAAARHEPEAAAVLAKTARSRPKLTSVVDGRGPAT